MMATITISLPETLKDFIEEQVSREGFGTVSEYVRSLVREEQKRKAQLRLEALLLEGLEGETTEVTPQDWAEIREEVLRRVRKRKSEKG